MQVSYNVGMFYRGEDAMSLAFLSFVTLSLFMLHEFDEIILIRPWISQNQEHQDYQKEMFIARRGSYLSAEIIALMIAEEFLLAFILLLPILFLSHSRASFGYWLLSYPPSARPYHASVSLSSLGTGRLHSFDDFSYTHLSLYPLSMSAVSFLAAASDSKRVSDGFSFGKSGFFYIAELKS